MTRRYAIYLFIALAMCAMCAPAQAATSGLGIAGEYNAFIFNNYTGYSDTQGRLAAGGDVKLTGYGVGDRLSSTSTGNSLVAGGNLNFTNGQVYHGNVVVGGDLTATGAQVVNGSVTVGGNLNVTNAQSNNGDVTVGGTATTIGSTLNGGTLHTGAGKSEMPFSFTAQADYLTRLSTSLANLSTTGTVNNEWGGLKLMGAGAKLEVFNIDGATLGNPSTWGLDRTDLSNLAQDATVVINVSGSEAGLHQNMESLAGISSNVLFNFYEATKLTLQGGIWGSILAPLADVAGADGAIDGTLIASSFDGNMEQHINSFTGNLPSPTPLPGALVLLGTGMAGLAAFRRYRG